MHEVSLIAGLIKEIEAEAKAENAVKITKIRVKIGKTEHVTPESFQFWFDELSKESIACGAAVEFAPTEEGGDAEEGVYLESIELEVDE